MWNRKGEHCGKEGGRAAGAERVVLDEELRASRDTKSGGNKHSLLHLVQTNRQES
jgi:hypothetical protein